MTLVDTNIICNLYFFVKLELSVRLSTMFSIGNKIVLMMLVSFSFFLNVII